MDPLEPKLGRRLGPATRTIHKKAPEVRVETEALAPDLMPSTCSFVPTAEPEQILFST